MHASSYGVPFRSFARCSQRTTMPSHFRSSCTFAGTPGTRGRMMVSCTLESGAK